MQKSTSLKAFLLMSLISLGTLSAQQFESNKVITKKPQFSKKSAEEIAKTNGFERCSTVEYEEYLQAKYPGRLTENQFEAWIAPLIENARNNKSQNGNVITIPVVVHVIHSGQNLGTAPNIVDEQVMSQITVMNNDFRKMLNTPGYNTNAVGADVQIQFALAKVDPSGNPTNGIDRVNLCQDNWTRADIEGFVKPQTIWNPNLYMNMWSVSFADASLLGYAQFPSSSGLQGLNVNGGLANTDGVVANFATFGSRDYNTNNNFLLSAPYDRGRTMTHEVGHFLGLRHIWGDAACGTDYCADTPTAHTENYACNTNIASCDDPTIPEMVRNYMDYTPDLCMNIFTNDQKTRIRTVMDVSPRRMQLKSSTADQAIALFANDAELKIDGGCSLESCGGGTVRFSLYNRGTANLTSATINYVINGGSTQTYNWTGNLAQDKYSIINISVPGTVPTGSPVSASITSVNGTTDQRTTNNVTNGTYNKPVAPQYIPTATTVNFNLQLDYFGSETMWTLKNSAGQIVKYGGPYPDVVDPTATTPLPTLISQTWSLAPGCYVFNISDAYGDGLDYGGYVDLSTPGGQTIYHGETDIDAYASKAFTTVVLGTSEINKNDGLSIYPNPTNDVLNITKVSGKATFEIHNAIGQLVKAGNISNNQVRVTELVKGTYIITIKDGKTSESIKFIKN